MLLQVDIPGPLGNSAVQILEYLPNLSSLNGVSRSDITESSKHVIISSLQPRLPEWEPTEPPVDRVLNAMWLYLMTYRLADEEKIDETPVWYVLCFRFFFSCAYSYYVSALIEYPNGQHSQFSENQHQLDHTH